MPGARLLVVDRDEESGLSPALGQSWEAVIDVSRQPGQVRRAVRDLDADHYAFISSGNVYADFTRLEQAEDAPLLEPLDGDVMTDMSEYGAAKVACEQAVREGVSSSTVIRSGLIVGPGDPFGRAGYYPWRFAHPTGPDVLVPDDLERLTPARPGETASGHASWPRRSQPTSRPKSRSSVPVTA